MYGRVKKMSKTKTIYLCPITNTQCDGCGGDSDCGLHRKPKEVPVRINTNLSYELSSSKFNHAHKIQQFLFTFSKIALYLSAAYCISVTAICTIYVILRVIIWLL